MSTFKGTPVADLAVGVWYLLVFLDDDGIRTEGEIAEYIGDGEFEDEGGYTHRVCSYDEFVRQS